ncbi:hypothetical protein, partial [Raoultella terrigena]|uniref:hypothetical protein n=1 Tax=Raoultella terrigena TaxID=577 RepID=UPI0027BB10F2
MTRLIDDYDALVSDLDGVVVAGASALAHAVDSVNSLPVPVVFVTNNASRTPSEVGAMLRGHGVRTSDDRVLTSSFAAARELAEVVPPGSPVLAIGGPGVAVCLRDAGLEPRSPQDEGEVVALVQGYGSG